MNRPLSEQWFPPAHAEHHQIPTRIRAWLDDEGSLTQRLKDHCSGQFNVRLLGMDWEIAEQSEASLLAIPSAQQVLVRQVRLQCDQQPWVYARSVIPGATLGAPDSELARLGDKPLGEYLFASPTLERKRVEWVLLRPGDSLFQQAQTDANPLGDEIWGRRSLFTIDAKPLLVSEFFLPQLFDQTEEST